MTEAILWMCVVLLATLFPTIQMIFSHEETRKKVKKKVHHHFWRHVKFGFLHIIKKINKMIKPIPPQSQTIREGKDPVNKDPGFGQSNRQSFKSYLLQNYKATIVILGCLVITSISMILVSVLDVHVWGPYIGVGDAIAIFLWVCIGAFIFKNK